MNAAYRVKLVILGDSAVGKTSLLKYFVEGKKPQIGLPTTIGVDFKIKHVERMINGSREQVQVQVWDTAGQERFRTITPMMYKSTQGPNGKMNSMGLIVCYDITQRNTYDESVDFWVAQLREHAADNVVTCLVGNKVDLAEQNPEQRSVPREEGEALAKTHKIDYFYETSAFTGEAVEEMFLKIVDEVLVRITRDEEEALDEPAPATMTLHDGPSGPHTYAPKEPEKGCKC